ncbi:glycosyltransferase family 4 protein [Clostridium perfringens]|nr:glycosyltransferase family 4 protein [Clostridium perfringens]
MKKVLYITTVSGTINAFLVPHIKMLINNGYKVDCACYITKDIDLELYNLGVKVYNLPFARNPLNFKNIIAFNKLIKIQKENKYDIIHVHTPVASILGRMMKVRFPNIKIIYTAHGYHFYKGASKKNWLLYYPIEKFMAKLTDITININSEDYEITKNKLKPKKCYLVNGVGVDLNKYRQLSEDEKVQKKKEMKILKDDFVLIMIAELNANKNQVQLIKAIGLLKDRYPNIKALLVGRGSLQDELVERVKKMKLDTNVKILGFRNDINELINISDIGVLLSYREGLPRSIMELMANKKRVIATNIRGCRDLIINSELGELVEVEDYKNTALIIEKYYLQRHISENVDFKLQRFEIQNILKDMKEIYEKI